MEGFSDTLLQNHFRLYQGYVKNTNLLAENLQTLLKAGKTDGPEYAEQKRRFGFEFDGMRLHEYLLRQPRWESGAGPEKSSLRCPRSGSSAVIHCGGGTIATGARAVSAGWDSLSRTRTAAGCSIPGSNEPTKPHHLAGCKAILVMDVFEHAYMTDYQLDRARYIEAFFKNIQLGSRGEKIQQIALARILPGRANFSRVAPGSGVGWVRRVFLRRNPLEPQQFLVPSTT